MSELNEGVTCRGCYALGTACQRCSKCRKAMTEFMAWKNNQRPATALGAESVRRMAMRILYYPRNIQRDIPAKEALEILMKIITEETAQQRG